jgi:adenine-specific DNA glycosylase
LVEVSLTEDDIKRLGNEAIETYRLIERGVFEANPVPKNCSFCEFENVCEARQEQKRLNAAKRKPKEPKKYDNYKTFTLGGGKL